jgi:hypothetical protein
LRLLFPPRLRKERVLGVFLRELGAAKVFDKVAGIDETAGNSSSRSVS